MKTDILSILEFACVAGTLALVGCSSDSPASSPATAPRNAAELLGMEGGPVTADAGCPAVPAGCPAADAGPLAEVQLPPTGGDAEISAWIAKGYYKSWTCEPSPHPARPNGAHGVNRVCSNAVLSAHGAGEFPVGSAGVKELYNEAGTLIIGYASYRKVAAGAGGAWYWYEKTTEDGLIANGLGTSGVPKTVCASCHSSAGTGRLSGHDFVYTQVR